MCGQSLFRFWGLQEDEALKLRQSAQECGKVVSPTHRPPLPPRNISGAILRPEELCLPSNSAVPQGTEPPRELQSYVVSMKYVYVYKHASTLCVYTYMRPFLSFSVCPQVVFVEQMVGKLREHPRHRVASEY
jgi:hypothetical protein